MENMLYVLTYEVVYYLTFQLSKRNKIGYPHNKDNVLVAEDWFYGFREGSPKYLYGNQKHYLLLESGLLIELMWTNFILLLESVVDEKKFPLRKTFRWMQAGFLLLTLSQVGFLLKKKKAGMGRHFDGMWFSVGCSELRVCGRRFRPTDYYFPSARNGGKTERLCTTMTSVFMKQIRMDIARNFGSWNEYFMSNIKPPAGDPVLPKLDGRRHALTVWT